MRLPGRASWIGFIAGVALATVLATGTLTRILWTKVTNHLGNPAEPVHLLTADFGNAVFHGNLENPNLEEASGMAVSRRAEDLLWVVNDSGSDPTLYAVTKNGRDRGSVRVEGVENRDWEGLVSIEHRGKFYLIVGEIGDNRAAHDEVHFWGIEEPTLLGERFPEGSTAPVAFRVDAHYEDGARDAEAFVLDTENQRILLLSKRDAPPQLYEIRLASLLGNQTVTARRVGVVDKIPAPTARELEEGNFLARFRSQPTAMDITSQGRSAIVLTYGDAYEFLREPEETWEAALAKTPRRISLPPLRQSEALAIDPIDGSLWVTSEWRPSPLFRLPRDRSKLQPR